VTRQRAAESRAYRVTRKGFAMLRFLLIALVALFLLRSPVLAHNSAVTGNVVPPAVRFDSDPILDDFAYDLWRWLMAGIGVGSGGNTSPCSCARCW
jgi:hypothetical protein